MKLSHHFYTNFKQLFGGKVNKKIFFLHINKCGGTSLKDAIQASFGIKKNIGKGSFWRIQDHSAYEVAEILGESVRDYQSKLLLYFMHHDKYRYITGHFGWSNQAYKQFSHKWNFITVLRDPISRWFSAYFYLTSTKTEFRERWNCDLKSYLNSETAIKQGRKYVLTLTEGISLEKADSEVAINQAIKNLDNFNLVGILENLDLFNKDYHQLFGAKLLIPKLNTNKVSHAKQKEMITDDILEKVKEICYPDLRVYEHVVRKLSSQSSWLS